MGTVDRPAELELGVREDDAALTRELLRTRVDREGQVAQRARVRLADRRHDRLVGDVLVVLADRRLRGGREDRLRQARAVRQAAGQRDAAHRSVRPVLDQAGAREIAAGHALDREHVEAAADHRPACDGVGHTRRPDLGRDQVVAHDVREQLEPPERELRQHAALVGDGGRQHEVVRADAVARDDEDDVPVLGRGGGAGLRDVQVPDLPRVDVSPAWQCVGHEGSPARVSTSVSVPCRRSRQVTR